jgi:hypothetical protein
LFSDALVCNGFCNESHHREVGGIVMITKHNALVLQLKY